VATVAGVIADRSPADQQALWSGNAIRIYRMG
jgi:hypothetical protein